MRKKSHISLGKYLVDTMNIRELKQCRKSFLVGSILPDCKPSFITKRHEYDETYEALKLSIRELTENSALMRYNPQAYWRKMGEVLHFVADYFTYPHNTVYDGTLKDHCHYENDLKHYLRYYLFSGKAHRSRKTVRDFSSREELCAYLEQRHEEYMNDRHNVESDARYITDICTQMLNGMYQLMLQRVETEGIPAVAAA